MLGPYTISREVEGWTFHTDLSESKSTTTGWVSTVILQRFEPYGPMAWKHPLETVENPGAKLSLGLDFFIKKITP